MIKLQNVTTIAPYGYIAIDMEYCTIATGKGNTYYCNDLKLFTKFLKQQGKDSLIETLTPWGEFDYLTMVYDGKTVKNVKGIFEGDLLDFNSWLAKMYKMHKGKIPQTKTALVRRKWRAGMTHYDRNNFKDIEMSIEVFNKLNNGFVGGVCLANKGEYENVVCLDVSSSYPHSLLQPMPMDSFEYWGNHATVDTLPENMAWIATAVFHNIKVKNDMMAFLYDHNSESGHMRSADEYEIEINNVDFSCIELAYNFDDVEFKDIYTCEWGLLPNSARKMIKDAYITKQTKPKDSEERAEAKIFINSLFGLQATAPYVSYYDGTTFTKRNIEDALEEYNNNSNRAWAYQIGVFCASWSRLKLLMANDLVLSMGGTVLYNDTDSIWLLRDDKILEEFDEWNRQIRNANDCITRDLGTWAVDGLYEKMRVISPKCYAALDKDGKTKAVASGANVKSVPYDEFVEGAVIKDATCVFNDNTKEFEYHDFTIGGGLEGMYLRVVFDKFKENL